MKTEGYTKSMLNRGVGNQFTITCAVKYGNSIAILIIPIEVFIIHC